MARQPLLTSNSDLLIPALQRELHLHHKSARIKARRSNTIKKLGTTLIIKLSNNSFHVTYHLFSLPKYGSLPHYLCSVFKPSLSYPNQFCVTSPLFNVIIPFPKSCSELYLKLLLHKLLLHCPLIAAPGIWSFELLSPYHTHRQ